MVQHLHKTWNLDKLKFIDYGIECNNGSKCLLVVTYISMNLDGKYHWKIKSRPSKRNSFGKIFSSLIREPCLVERFDEKDFEDSFCTDFPDNKHIEKFCRYTRKEATFAKRFNRTTHKKEQFSRKGNANGVDAFPSLLEKDTNNVHSSI